MWKKIQEDLRKLIINFFPSLHRYAFAADFPLVLSNCYYDNIQFKYRLENNIDLYETLFERYKRKHIETIMYFSMMKYFANISIDQYINLKNDETLLQKILEEEKEKNNRKKKKV